MTDQFVLQFRKMTDRTYRLEGTLLRELDDAGMAVRTKTMKAKSSASAREIVFPESDSVLLIALAFVRTAQWQFVRLADTEGRELPIFRGSQAASAVQRFQNLRADATKNPTQDGHHRKWLQAMLSFDDDDERQLLGGRLNAWFTVSQRPRPMVKCHLSVLHPASVQIIIDGQAASEAEMDWLEAFLARKLVVGYPCHLEINGTTIAGRPPSVQPQWFGQEAECLEMDRTYADQIPVLAILGRSGLGKTVLASNWLRRLIGTHKNRQKRVFSWSFSRQGAERFIPMPLLSFFSGLAEALEVSFDPSASPVEQANLVLEALVHQPTMLFLDGVEAVFRLPQPGESASIRAEIPAGLTHLLRGITNGNGSFVLATSTEGFTDPFGLPASSVHHLNLKEMAAPPGEEFTKEYEPDVGRERAGTSDDHAFSAGTERSSSALDAALSRSLARISGLQSPAAVEQWTAQRGEEVAPPEGYFHPLPALALSAAETMKLRIIQNFLKGSLAEVLFYCLCACHAPLAEDDLLAVVATIAPGGAQRRSTPPTREAWISALESLIENALMEQASRHDHYSVHAATRRPIAESLKRNNPAFWIAINKALAERFLSGAEDLPDTRAGMVPLVEAAIYLCQAGEKYRAYADIGLRRLSRGLKGYAVFHLGDYESPRTINQAMLSDLDSAAGFDLPPEAEAMCIHVNSMCLRFQNQLEDALREERKAWVRARLTGNPFAIFPVGANLLRLCHVFGLLAEAREVEKALAIRLFKGKVFGVGKNLAREDSVDGASALSAILALNLLYRGKTVFARWTLEGGIKDCRNNGAEFQVLLPTYGRPWHALILLETGQWQRCEEAFETDEWGSEMVRFRQTGFFEVLAAMMFLAKARTASGVVRDKALASAAGWSDKALRLAKNGAYQWWTTLATLTRGRILALDQQPEGGRECVESALVASTQSSFQLLRVDALQARAELARDGGQFAEAQQDVAEAMALASQLGYELRKPALKKLEKAVNQPAKKRWFQPAAKA